jgi:hypothetical protein
MAEKLARAQHLSHQAELELQSALKQYKIDQHKADTYTDPDPYGFMHQILDDKVQESRKVLNAAANKAAYANQTVRILKHKMNIKNNV